MHFKLPLDIRQIYVYLVYQLLDAAGLPLIHPFLIQVRDQLQSGAEHFTVHKTEWSLETVDKHTRDVLNLCICTCIQFSTWYLGITTYCT